MRVGNGYVASFSLLLHFRLDNAVAKIYAGFGTPLRSALLPVDVLAHNQEF